MTQLLDDLKNARAFLVEHGWIRGRSTDGNGNYCAYGAVCYSLNNEKNHQVREHYVLKALEKCLPDGYSDVIHFNDSRYRTKEEVVAIFDCAIQQKDANGG